MKTLTKITFFFLLVSFSITNASAQKKYELRYNLKTNDKYAFVTEVVQDISFDANGQTMTLDQEMSFTMESTVTDVKDNEITQDIKFQKMAMNQSIFGMEIIYDSEDESTWEGMGAQVAAELNKIIGKSINYVMDDKGKVIDMDVSAINDNSDITNNLQSGNTYAMYPEDKVSVGDTWEAENTPLKNSDMSVHFVYTLVKASNKKATITFKGDISANELAEMPMKIEGTISGQMEVDVKTGMAIETTTDTEMDMEMEKDGMKIPASISTTSTTQATKM